MTALHDAAKAAALAERDRLVYPANEAVQDWVIESIVEAALAAYQEAFHQQVCIEECKCYCPDRPADEGGT